MLETRFLTDCGDIRCGIKIGCSPLFVLFRPSGPHPCYELYIYIYIYIVLHIELECVLTTLCELLEWEIYFKSVTYLFYSKRERLRFCGNSLCIFSCSRKFSNSMHSIFNTP